MSGFSSGWLALREPYDKRARSAAVLDAAATWAAGKNSIAVVVLQAKTPVGCFKAVGACPACGNRVCVAWRGQVHWRRMK